MTLKKALLGLICFALWVAIEVYFPIESSVTKSLPPGPEYPPLLVSNVPPVPPHDH